MLLLTNNKHNPYLKILAILMVFIFSFESAGYCLRVPVGASKGRTDGVIREVETKNTIALTVKQSANLPEALKRWRSIGKSQGIAAVFLGMAILFGGANGAVYSQDLFLAQNTPNIRKGNLEQKPRLIWREETASPIAIKFPNGAQALIEISPEVLNNQEAVNLINIIMDELNILRKKDPGTHSYLKTIVIRNDKLLGPADASEKDNLIFNLYKLNPRAPLPYDDVDRMLGFKDLEAKIRYIIKHELGHKLYNEIVRWDAKWHRRPFRNGTWYDHATSPSEVFARIYSEVMNNLVTGKKRPLSISYMSYVYFEGKKELSMDEFKKARKDYAKARSYILDLIAKQKKATGYSAILPALEIIRRGL